MGLLLYGLKMLKNKTEGFGMSEEGKYVSSYILGLISSILIICNAIPAVLVAINCNPDQKILYGIIGLLFSDIYLIQWAIRKFVLKSSNYCKLVNL